MKRTPLSKFKRRISDADHDFFCDARRSYNPSAAAEAWPLTLAFLRLHTAQAATTSL